MTSLSDQVAQAFCQYYYNTFATDRTQLASLYNNESLMTFEGIQCQGQEAIIKKLMSMPFQKISHNCSALDSQFVGGSSGSVIIVTVMGQLKTDDDPAHSFVQSFVLQRAGESWVIINDIFRMVLHNM